MDNFNDIDKERVAAVSRVMHTTRCIKDDNVPARIEEGLYLGSIGAAKSRSLLKRLNISHVLTVSNSLPPAYPDDFTYKIVDVSDRENVDIARYFDDCVSFIDEAKRTGGVLVHCFVGRSRSVTIVVAYLMKKHGMRLSEALNFVKSKRSMASPNSGFMSQLKNLEKSIPVVCQGMASNEEPVIVTKTVRQKTHWEHETHMVFVELCLDEIKSGNRPGSHFNKVGWTNLIKNMKARVNKDFTKIQLKNHWDSMKKDWKLYDRLMRIESGLGWDPVKKTIHATPEWWDEKIKADPELVKFRDRNLEVYRMYYGALFGDYVAIGDKTKTTSQLVQDIHVKKTNLETDTTMEDIQEGLGDSDEVLVANQGLATQGVGAGAGAPSVDDGVGGGLAGVQVQFPESSFTRKSACVQNTRGPAKRGRLGQTSTFEVKLDTVLQALSSRSTQTFPKPKVIWDIQECCDKICEFPGFKPGSENYFDALEVFMDGNAREAFMVPPTIENKIQLLYRLMSRLPRPNPNC